MTVIGYQSGIRAAVNRLRDLDPKGTALTKDAKGKWPALETLPDDLSRWGAWDKLERTLGILTADHDGTQPDPPPPPPPPTYKRVAPRVAYKAGGSDARYCLKDFPTLRDDVATYDANGLCLGGRTDGSAADCPTSALEIDGRPYCSLPTQGDPTKNTGSWLI